MVLLLGRFVGACLCVCWEGGRVLLLGIWAVGTDVYMYLHMFCKPDFVSASCRCVVAVGVYLCVDCV